MIFPEMPFKVIRYPEVDSTNTIALAMGGRGAAHGTVVNADMQTGGKGRLSRHFSSPRGGLYASVILRPDIPDQGLPLITLAAGAATALAIESCAGVSLRLKWPNDLYLNGKKLGGILTEAAPYSQQSCSIPFIVVGIGVNVNTRRESFPDSLQELATSLYCQTGLNYDIDGMLRSVVAELLKAVELLAQRPADVLSSWRDRDCLLNKNLCWLDPRGQSIHGIGSGLLPDGRYRLMTVNGQEHQVMSGDIILTEIEGRNIKTEWSQ